MSNYPHSDAYRLKVWHYVASRRTLEDVLAFIHRKRK